MRQELRRIETMLTQLADQHGNAPSPNALSTVSPQATLAAPATLPSFEMRRRPPSQPLPKRSTVSAAIAESVTAPSPADMGKTKALSLPRLKSFSVTSHRNAANPSLAVNLLKAIEGIANSWQEELRQVLRQIQDIYLEGPIVDGWLESYAPEDNATVVHPSEVATLMSTIDANRGTLEQPDAKQLNSDGQPDAELSNFEQLNSEQLNSEQLDKGASLPPQTIAGLQANAAGYRLCGLNEDGQLWFRHCPAEQLPAISLAIARYQRLKQLLARKQYLEKRLSKLAETLVVVHGQLNGACTLD